MPLWTDQGQRAGMPFLPSILNSRPLLIGVILLQWIVMTLLLNFSQVNNSAMPSSACTPSSGLSKPKERVDVDQILAGPFLKDPDEILDFPSLPGVGVTILFRSPQWFHLRITHMIHNALTNLPPHWGLHLFINPSWFFGEAQVLSWHPGLKRLLAGDSANLNSSTNVSNVTSYRASVMGRPIFVTWLPDHLTKRPAKPKGVLHSRWFWEQIKTERVLLFSGNGAFCGNHILSKTTAESTGDEASTIWQAWGWSQRAHVPKYLDYLASPWRQMQGLGGDGSSHSYRNRTSMLRLLHYVGDRDTRWQSDAEHVWVLRHMQSYNQEQSGEPGFEMFRIASEAETQQFGGVLGISENNALSHVPYVASGTFANLAYDERETLLKHCTELKTIFPSLHEPACFGAHPKPETCRQSICALQESLPSSGC